MKKIEKKTIYIAIGTLVLGILIGSQFFGGSGTEHASDNETEELVEKIWTCSMHPQIRQSEPGKCPICGMELIPLNNESVSNEYPMEIKMSPTAMKLANVHTSVVGYQKAVKEVRMNGKVKADERNIFSQSTHIPGRVEKLLINFTGESVREGQVLAYIYSPDLVLAQEELFEAEKIKESQPALYKAARGKLLSWKLTENQIDDIIQSGQARDQFPLLADVSGVVLNKKVNLGDYIKKGQVLFDVVDLSKIWVLFDVYENDIAWVKKGDKVEFTVASLPSETFKGNIIFVDPLINPNTRVASARVEISNPDMELKPDMFAVGIAKSHIQRMKEELIVPKSSVMWTGERSVIYIKQTRSSGISFRMQEITIGPALGDSYIVLNGLEEGTEIATNGTFTIDAAAQLAGKPSMMNPEGGVVMTGHNHGESSEKAKTTTSNTKVNSVSKEEKAVFVPFVKEYLLLKDALILDDFEKSVQISASLLNTLSKIDMGVFTGKAHNIWMEHNSVLKTTLKLMSKSENIGEVRSNFKIFSDHFIMLAITFGPFDQELYVQHCPMANGNKGADWISAEEKIQNPYFGQDMLGCGNITREIK